MFAKVILSVLLATAVSIKCYQSNDHDSTSLLSDPSEARADTTCETDGSCFLSQGYDNSTIKHVQGCVSKQGFCDIPSITSDRVFLGCCNGTNFCNTPSPPTYRSCVGVTDATCPNAVTVFPNRYANIDHEATAMIDRYSPLRQMNCSDYLEEFLCAAYKPSCGFENYTTSWLPTYPCRALCEEVRNSSSRNPDMTCVALLARFGHEQPDIFNCDLSDTDNCFGGGLVSVGSSRNTANSTADAQAVVDWWEVELASLRIWKAALQEDRTENRTISPNSTGTTNSSAISESNGNRKGNSVLTSSIANLAEVIKGLTSSILLAIKSFSGN